MKSNITTIVWDLGNVLIKWDPKHLFRKIFDTEEKVDWFLSEVCTLDWNEQQDAGRTWAEGTYILGQQFPGYQKEINAYAERWEETLVGPIDESVSLLKKLKEANTHRIYALTNWSAETFPIALERYDFLQLFEGIVVSGVEKLKKPDPKIYQLLLERYQIAPQEALFIDDSARNIAGARAVGMQAIHFLSPTQLATDLKAYQVIS